MTNYFKKVLADNETSNKKDDAMSLDMSPSNENEISKGQIQKMFDVLEHGLRKADVSRIDFQVVLEMYGHTFVDDMVGAIRAYTALITDTQTFTVSTAYAQTVRDNLFKLEQAGWKFGGRPASVPVDIFLHEKSGTFRCTIFKVCGNIPLSKEYKLRELRPADPILLAELNRTHPALHIHHPNTTMWGGSTNDLFSITFEQGDGTGLPTVHLEERHRAVRSVNRHLSYAGVPLT